MTNWYAFINIREETTTKSMLTESNVYTLMDSKTFHYYVYDVANDRVAEMEGIGTVDESNLNHNWMVFEIAGRTYIYNLGNKKFLQKSGNTLCLSSESAPLSMSDGADGIIFESDDTRQWSFVKNNHLQSDKDITPVEQIKAEALKSSDSTAYDLTGRKIQQSHKGVYIMGGKKYLSR